jgi:pyrroline-5-carboxylate reductase
MMLKDKTIAVVGVGKIGGALIAGLLQSGMVRRDALAGSTGHGETARRAAETYGIPVLTDNRELVRGRDIIILAVKPQNVRRVLTEVRDLVTPEQLVITLAAATPTARIEEILERPVPVVRAMPNMPCLVQKGMTVLCPGRQFSESGGPARGPKCPTESTPAGTEEAVFHGVARKSACRPESTPCPTA